MSKIQHLGFLAAFAAATSLATGCSQTWPSVQAVGDARFLSHQLGTVTTIDVLPVDVAVAANDEVEGSVDDVAALFDDTAAGAISAQLDGHGYQVSSFIDWQGGFARPDGRAGVAMTPESVSDTLGSLSSFGFAQARSHIHLAPYLPARLGGATGADATLYVGGYSFAGHDAGGITASDVAKGVFIALFIVVIVVIVAAAAKGGGHIGGGGGGGGGGHVGGGGGGGPHIAGGNPHVGGGGSGGGVHGGAVSPRADAFRIDVHPNGPNTTFHEIYRFGGHHHSPIQRAAHMIDSYGRLDCDTQLCEYEDHEDEVPDVPEAGPSRTLLEMTLIDNRTGQTLWHARQIFPANPAKPHDVVEAISRMMTTLPARLR